MEVTRLAISRSPVPILSVEFRRKSLYVWRVELFPCSDVVGLVGQLRDRFPQYLQPVSRAQLLRLIKLAFEQKHSSCALEQ